MPARGVGVRAKPQGYRRFSSTSTGHSNSSSGMQATRAASATERTNAGACCPSQMPCGATGCCGVGVGGTRAEQYSCNVKARYEGNPNRKLP